MFNQKGLLSLIAIVFGVILAPMLVYAIELMRGKLSIIPLFVLSLFASLLFLPAFITFAIRSRRGTAISVSVSIGLIVGLLTPYTWDSILLSLMIGMLAESVLLLNGDSAVWNRRYALISVMLGALQFAINIIGHDLELLPLMWLGLLLVTLISGIGIVWAGIHVGQKLKSVVTT